MSLDQNPPRPRAAPETLCISFFLSLSRSPSSVQQAAAAAESESASDFGAVAGPLAGARAPHAGERAAVERTSGGTLFPPTVRSSRNPETLDLPSSFQLSFSQPHEHAPGGGTVVRSSISFSSSESGRGLGFGFRPSPFPLSLICFCDLSFLFGVHPNGI